MHVKKKRFIHIWRAICFKYPFNLVYRIYNTTKWYNLQFKMQTCHISCWYAKSCGPFQTATPSYNAYTCQNVTVFSQHVFLPVKWTDDDVK